MSRRGFIINAAEAKYRIEDSSELFKQYDYQILDAGAGASSDANETKPFVGIFAPREALILSGYKKIPERLSQG